MPSEKLTKLSSIEKQLEIFFYLFLEVSRQPGRENLFIY